MSKAIKEEAQEIIKDHVLFSTGAGIIPFPFLDIMAITAIQMDMIKALCTSYGIDYHETRGKAIATALSGTTLGRIAGYGIGSVFKIIPGVGTLLGGITLAITAGASTYAVGQVFAYHFEGGGSLFDLDPEQFNKFYREQVERGKELVRQWKDESEPEEETKEPSNKKTEIPKSPILEELESAEKLRQSGALTEEEFQDIKEELLRRFMAKKKKK